MGPLAHLPPRRVLLRRSGAVLALLLLAIAFTAVNWQVSQRIGRLSTVTNYDDVVYLNKASEIYFAGRDEGVAAGVHRFVTGYLHAPFSVGLALGGFLIFGPRAELIYFMLALVVFAYLACVAMLARGAPPILRAALVLASLALPFATTAALEFRPDPMWAVVLGAGSVGLLVCERPFAGWRTSALFGFAFGAALLTKPSTFAMTILVMGGTWILAALAALLARRARPVDVARGFGVTLLVALLVAGWYCLPNAASIFNYFFQNSFGENREIWTFHGNPWARWFYYFRGEALGSNVGGLVFPLVLAYVVGAVQDLRRGDIFARVRGGAFLWMLLCLVLVNSAFGMKSPFLGGSLYAFVIFGGLWRIARFLEWGARQSWWPRPARQALAGVALIAVAASAYSFSEVSRVSLVARKAQNSTNRGVLKDLMSDLRGVKEASVLVAQGNPVVWEFLAMETRARGKRLRVDSAAFLRDARTILRVAGAADYFVLQDQKLAGSPGVAIPSEAFLPELLAHVQASPDWRLLGRYPDHQGRFAYLYKNLKPTPVP